MVSDSVSSVLISDASPTQFGCTTFSKLFGFGALVFSPSFMCTCPFAVASTTSTVSLVLHVFGPRFLGEFWGTVCVGVRVFGGESGVGVFFFFVTAFVFYRGGGVSFVPFGCFYVSFWP